MQRPPADSRAPGRKEPPAAGTAASVLVSGGAGFIGAALVEALTVRGARCTVVDDLSAGTGPRLARLLDGPRPPAWLGLDLTRPGAWERALGDAGPFDRLVHLAARVGVPRVLADPAGCRRSTLAGVRELIRAVAALPPGERPRVFAASTSEVYAESAGAQDERSGLRPTGGAGRWAYAGSKLEAEAALDAARPLWERGLGPVHLRFFNVVGPGQDARAGMVVPTFVERALAGWALPVHGSGRAVRTFGHVEHVAAALAELVLRPAFPEGPLNLGGGTRASVLELARAVRAHARRRLAPPCRIERVDPRRTVSGGFEEVTRREPDLSRARGLGVHLPTMTLDELVDDCLDRHAALALEPVYVGPASLEHPGGAQTAVGAKRSGLSEGGVPVGGGACASPGS